MINRDDLKRDTIELVSNQLKRVQEMPGGTSSFEIERAKVTASLAEAIASLLD